MRQSFLLILLLVFLGIGTLPGMALGAGPDLTASDVTVPDYAKPGETITIGDTTKNIGDQPAPMSTTYYYLSVHQKLDENAILLGARPVPALAAGDPGKPSTIKVQLPKVMANGTWYIIAFADGSGLVPETDESNNASYDSGNTFFLVGPDLISTDLTAPDYASPGQTITVGETTWNKSKVNVPASTTTYYYISSHSSCWDVLPPSLARRNVPALPAGTSSPGTVSMTVPMNLTGSYWILAQADGDGPGVVDEASERNNCNAKRIEIGPKRPDLITSVVTGPSILWSHMTTITIGDTTTNSGPVNAPASTTYYYLSANPGDTSGIPLAKRSVPLLQAGGLSTGETTMKLPDTMAVGFWYIIAKADGPGQVPETSETNNTSFKKVFYPGKDFGPPYPEINPPHHLNHQ